MKSVHILPKRLYYEQVMSKSNNKKNFDAKVLVK